jgi:uncharacterized protein (TIRG00374 family)
MNEPEKNPVSLSEEQGRIRHEKGKKKNAKLIWSLLFFLSMTALVISLFLNFGDIKAISETFTSITKGTNWVWLLPAASLVVIYLLLWPLSLCLFAHAKKIKASFSDVYAIGEVEHFYNGVTPMATGGQPFQIYYFNAIGVSPSESTGTILATFGTYLLVTNVYAIAALATYPILLEGIQSGSLPSDLSWMNSTAFLVVTILGYFFNIQTMVFTFLIGANDRVKNWIVALANWLSRRKLFRKILAKQMPRFMAFCEATQTGFHEILTHKKHFILAFLIRFVAVGCFYAIPYFLLKAFGASFPNESLAFWILFFATSFAITAVVWLPTPGTTGGIDYMFAIVIASLLAEGLIVPGADGLSSLATSLMWRLFTYYFPLFVSFDVSLVFSLKVAHQMKKKILLLEEKEKLLSPPGASTIPAPNEKKDDK